MLRASASTRASPELASRTILSAEGLARWWLGGVRDMEVDPSWPAVGARMAWTAAGGGMAARFETRVVENQLPSLLREEAKTPSGSSIITQRFEPLPGGGTRYEKTVEARFESWTGRLFVGLMLGFFVRSEVRRAAAVADEKTAEGQ